MQDTAGFYSIIDYTVDGPETQRELIDAFTLLQEKWVRFYPGYKSAHLFASIDGTRVYNIVHWVTEAAYREFERVSDNAGRQAAIQNVLDRLAGKAVPRMSGPPRYTIVREVRPGPRAHDV
ncbi:MAG: antibiotic biosynthesis monooxygenase [Labilithrix sp.]|nr:antibiotic biosynthesis monooxygenase [Labilithrix sp.]